MVTNNSLEADSNPSSDSSSCKGSAFPISKEASTNNSLARFSSPVSSWEFFKNLSKY